MANAGIDQNSRATLTALSSTGDGSIVTLYANPTTHRLLVDLSSGSGSVTSVSVVSANGFAGTVATATTTPAITLTTTITGLLKGNGTAISAATDGTDYLSSTTGVTLAQGIAQTIGTTTNRVLKLWATDITVTNAIVGSITGNAATATIASTVTTNANLTGVITSVGNATSIASQTGTGTKFVVDNGPTLIAPLLGTPASGTLTNCTGLPIAGLVASTSTAIGVGSIELGHATDTTIARVSAGVISVEGVTIPSISSTNTLTNKRINPRLVTAASYTTDTGTSLDISTCDQFEITAQAGALLFNAPSGTPVGGNKLIIRIKDNGTARALTYNAIFRAMGNALPTTTVISKTLYMGFIYNATDTKWDLVAVAQEA